MCDKVSNNTPQNPYLSSLDVMRGAAGVSGLAAVGSAVGRLIRHAFQSLTSPALYGAKPKQVDKLGDQPIGIRPPGMIPNVERKPISELNAIRGGRSEDPGSKPIRFTTGVGKLIFGTPIEKTEVKPTDPSQVERLTATSWTSSRELPEPTLQESTEAERYRDALNTDPELYQNAFDVTQVPSGPGQSKQVSLVPDGVRRFASTVDDDEGPHLYKSSSGMSGRIQYNRDKREVVVAFTGWHLEAEGLVGKTLAIVKNWFGFCPDAFRDAATTVGEMQSHLEQINKDLPENQKLKLTVVGYSFGGALASFAALKNKVPGVVFNPLHIGLGARAEIGQHQLNEADRYLTEVVVSSDWVSDPRPQWSIRRWSPLNWLGILRNSGPLGNARRFVLPNAPGKLGGPAHQLYEPLNNSIIRNALFKGVTASLTSTDRPQPGENGKFKRFGDGSGLQAALRHEPWRVVSTAMSAVGLSNNDAVQQAWKDLGAVPDKENNEFYWAVLDKEQRNVTQSYEAYQQVAGNLREALAKALNELPQEDNPDKQFAGYILSVFVKDLEDFAGNG